MSYLKEVVELFAHIKKLLSMGLVFALVLVFNAPLVRADEPEKELLKRIEKLEQEQAKAKVAGAIKIKGYVQARYESDQTASSSDTFKVKSAYVVPYGTIVPGWDFEVEIDAADTAGKPLRNAFIAYTALKPYATIRIGQQKPSYSEEFWTSSSVIDTIERALAVTSLSAERDIGLNVFGELFKNKLDYGLGVFNGTGINTTDTNDIKDFAGRLVFSPFKGSKGVLDGLSAGGAFWTGSQRQTTFDSTSVAGNINRYAGLLAYRYERLKLQGEYLSQTLDKVAGGEKKSDGWYVLGVYDLMKKDHPQLQLVAKYEEYDPDTDVSDNKQDITTVGLNYFFNKAVKVMVNYRIKNETPKVKNDQFLVQFQLKF